MAEAYYEGNYFDENLVFTLGMLDPTVYFDNNAVANDERTQFLNGGFKNNTAIEFPAYTVGARIKGSPSEWFYASAGIFSATLADEMEKHPFWMGEIGFTPRIKELDGHYRLYGWGNCRDHTNIKTGRTNDNGWGIGAGADQKITPWLTLFARGGHRKKDVYRAYISASGGVGISGSLYGREKDMFGAAYGVAVSNDDFVQGRNEQVIEAFYRLVVAKGHVGISPDIQVIINPTGGAATHNILIGGVRGNVEF